LLPNEPDKQIKSIENNVFIPLEFTEIKPNSKNILLIDNTVYQNEILSYSTNPNTFAIKYSYNSNKDELEKLLNNNFESIDRI